MLSDTRTQMSAGAAMLLLAHPVPSIGKARAVAENVPTTVYVMLNAIPEHGATFPHSLPPELSIVLTSTTPGPLSVSVLHAPVTLTPLMQMLVEVGLAIRDPKTALVGLR